MLLLCALLLFDEDDDDCVDVDRDDDKDDVDAGISGDDDAIDDVFEILSEVRIIKYSFASRSSRAYTLYNIYTQMLIISDHLTAHPEGGAVGEGGGDRLGYQRAAAREFKS